MSRQYPTLEALRRGEIVNFEGVGLVIDAGELRVGDTYIAERNNGPKLLTVKKLAMTQTPSEGPAIDYVVPKEVAYCFDVSECVKVKLAE